MAVRPREQASFEVMNPDSIRRVELALQDLRDGRLIILVDDEDRENEGDLVAAAEKITPETINFMARHARGLICLSLTARQVDRLGLPMMATNNQSQYHTAFTVSIEAREGVTTGISAADRARTVQAAIDPDATPRDIVTPGHIFPLRARDGGVLERVGQTEGSVDLARLAGLDPSGVICEIMNDDGSMARLPQLLRFGEEHKIRVCAVADVIRYRLRSERVVRRESEGTIELPGIGRLKTRLYRGLGSDGLHQALWLGDPSREPTLIRVQSAPPPWAFLAPETSVTAASAVESLRRIVEAGEGALVLMHLAAPLEPLRHQFVKEFEGQGDAPQKPHAEALRDLGTGCQILLDLGYRDLRLLTSSRRPIVGIEAYGLKIVDRIPLVRTVQGGEVRVTVYEGQLTDPGGRFAIVAARFNEPVVRALLAGALDTFRRHGVDVESRVDVAWVPGAFEIPLVCRALADTERYVAVVALGAVIRGATPHFEAVANAVSSGVAKASADTGVPVLFGVLTTDTLEQAWERSGTKGGNKGADVALAALEMSSLMRAMEL